MWGRSREGCVSEGEIEDREGHRWSRGRYSRGRASCDNEREPVKIVEIDTYRPYTKPQYHHQYVMQVTPSTRKMKHNFDDEIGVVSSVSASASASPRCGEKTKLVMPNYMTPTASAKARSLSTPRNRNVTTNNYSTPEKQKTPPSSSSSSSLKKRLFFSAPH